MLTFPNAKINLGLNITEKRPDGYHNLETIFYPNSTQREQILANSENHAGWSRSRVQQLNAPI